MTEEIKTEEPKQEQPDIIKIAEDRAKELETANAKLEDNLRKHDRLIAEAIVRGKAFAGQKERTMQDDINEEAELIAKAMGRSFKGLQPS